MVKIKISDLNKIDLNKIKFNARCNYNLILCYNYISNRRNIMSKKATVKKESKINVNDLSLKAKQELIRDLIQGEDFQESAILAKQAKNIHKEKANNLPDDKKQALVEDINEAKKALQKQIRELDIEKKERLIDLGIDYVKVKTMDGKNSMYDFRHTFSEKMDVVNFSIHKDGYAQNFICNIPITKHGDKDKNNYITEEARKHGIITVVDGEKKESGFEAAAAFFALTTKEYNNHSCNTWNGKLASHVGYKNIDVMLKDGRKASE